MAEYQLPKLGTRVRFPSLAPFLSFFVLSVLISGCATVDEFPAEVYQVGDRSAAIRRLREEERGPGVYHKVGHGETVWRIAKTYGVPIEEVIRVNHIPDVAIVEENQLIFIPGADTVKEIPLPQEDSKKDEFSWPVKGRVISYYGQGRKSYLSRGIMIEAEEGQPVGAARQGRVIFADYLSGYAFTVILDHLDGFFSVYSRNSKVLVKVGDMVLKGDQIALAGGAGDQSFLHFEIRKGGTPNNPLYYLPR